MNKTNKFNIVAVVGRFSIEEICYPISWHRREIPFSMKICGKTHLPDTIKLNTLPARFYQQDKMTPNYSRPIKMPTHYSQLVMFNRLNILDTVLSNSSPQASNRKLIVSFIASSCTQIS